MKTSLKPASQQLRVIIANDHPVVRHGLRAICETSREVRAEKVRRSGSDGSDRYCRLTWTAAVCGMKALYFLLLTTLAAVPAGEALTVLNGARIIDGTGRAPLENGALVIDGTKIVDTGAPDGIRPPPGAQFIDVHGKTIMPGLISAHSHLGLCQGAIGPKPEHYTRENVRNQLEQYERYGGPIPGRCRREFPALRNIASCNCWSRRV